MDITTQDLYKHILNRTFQLESRNVSIEPIGYRLADVALKSYNPNTDKYEVNLYTI